MIRIFESHPVQYKAPVYQELNRLIPGEFEVIYATDASVRPDNIDVEFGQRIAWDIPLLEGYRFRVLGNETRIPFGSPDSLSGRGVFTLLRKERPAAIVLTALRYRVDQAAYLSALILRIPILIRQETQDEMNAARRTRLTSWLRSLIYRGIYAPVRRAFAFGELNYEHLVRHGIEPRRITFSRFSVPDVFEGIEDREREVIRREVRQRYGIPEDSIVVGFVGKFIEKKNPDLVFRALESLPAALLRRLHLLFIGSGQLLADLEAEAVRAECRWGTRTTFTGFINQSELPRYYLAMDILQLPSRPMGEAWGLVVNEALNAGCGVVISEAVGCHREFGDLDRVRVVPVEAAERMACAIEELAKFPRDFAWARARMQAYSSRAAAEGIRDGLRPYLERDSLRDEDREGLFT